MHGWLVLGLILPRFVDREVLLLLELDVWLQECRSFPLQEEAANLVTQHFIRIFLLDRLLQEIDFQVCLLYGLLHDGLHLLAFLSHVVMVLMDLISRTEIDPAELYYAVICALILWHCEVLDGLASISSNGVLIIQEVDLLWLTEQGTGDCELLG